MEGLFVLFWLFMAIICAMIAGSKKGFFVALLFLIYGLIIWPIAFVHALLLRSSSVKEAPIEAEGVINGKPYWRTRDGRFCTVIEGRDIAFPDKAALEAALVGNSSSTAA
ncbi:hypothetical protein [Methylosinus sp. KRF6]|uniref:hypothetical protein n=1 Tax=Methylosinus sp. KRF6 TaxID=2846853 RepID=UPI001C0D3AE2|nr:hypothetical protein [Methylosinus sp. KRF6]MBU3887122.1 hypothetical protein [Methylosinus sp. KRF6]